MNKYKGKLTPTELIKFKNEVSNFTFTTKEATDAILKQSNVLNTSSKNYRIAAKEAYELALKEDIVAKSIDNANQKFEEAEIALNNVGLKYKTLGTAAAASMTGLT